jgi:hypothetical protein
LIISLVFISTYSNALLFCWIANLQIS